MISRPESGNAFFMILIGVVLFAALAFTFTRGSQQGGENITFRQAELQASDIMNYAQSVERAVQRLLSKNISENDLSFENDTVSGYTNAGCGVPACKIFNAAGGGLTWQSPPPDINNDNSTYAFTVNTVHSSDSTLNIGTAKTDLTMILKVKAPTCNALNAKTNGFPTWTSLGSHNTSTPFAGNYADLGDQIEHGASPAPQSPVGCFCDTSGCPAGSSHFFYYTIYAR